MPAGYVYVLFNRSMRDLVKVGKTTRSPEERAQELSRVTAVPTPFYVAFECHVRDCEAAERAVHEELASFRVRDDREFFRVDLGHAIRVVEMLAERFAWRVDRVPSLAEPSVIVPRESPVGAEVPPAPQRPVPPSSESSSSSPPYRSAHPPTRRAVDRSQPSAERLKGTQAVSTRCPACSHSYSVTLRRYESTVVCPNCGQTQDVAVPWDAWWSRWTRQVGGWFSR